MSEQRIDCRVEQGIARLRFARPEAHNAFDLAMLTEFARAAARCEQDDVNVILMEAAGPVFSVGGDLRDFVAHRADLETHVLEMAREFHLGVLSLRRARAPVIAAVQGMAAGGGFSLVLGADLVVAGEGARFNPAYTRSGVTPDGGGTWFLPRLVGPQRAFELFALNPTLTATEALALGIVTRVVPDAELAATVTALATTLARSLPGTLPALKRLLVHHELAALEAHLAREARSIAAQAASPATLAFFDQFLARR